jgi:nitroreductase
MHHLVRHGALRPAALRRPHECHASPVGAATWTELVDRARLAPSPHNTQPWRLRVRSDVEAELFAPVERLLPVEDPDGRFLTAGVGIFLEALDVAAGSRDLELDVEPLLPPLGRDASETAHVARLALRPRTAPAPYPADLLERRRTSRLPYDGRAVPSAVLERLAGVAAAAGYAATFTTDAETVRWVVRLNAATMFDDLREDDRREEIAHWTRLSEAEARERADGFSPRCLGFPAPLLGLFLRHHALCGPRPLRSLLTRVYLRSMRGTATVGWIAGPWDTPRACLEAGRMLMRFWLALTAEGLYMHPFGSVITNRRSRARLTERLAVDEREGEVWLLFRLGYSAEPPRSERLPAAAVVE